MDAGRLAAYIARWTGLMRLFLYLLALVAGMSPAQAGRLALAQPVAVASAAQTADQTAQADAVSAHRALIPVQSVRPPVADPAFEQDAPAPAFVSSELTDRPLE